LQGSFGQFAAAAGERAGGCEHGAAAHEADEGSAAWWGRGQ
jgi:hypothetical protein